MEDFCAAELFRTMPAAADIMRTEVTVAEKTTHAETTVNRNPCGTTVVYTGFDKWN